MNESFGQCDACGADPCRCDAGDSESVLRLMPPVDPDPATVAEPGHGPRLVREFKGQTVADMSGGAAVEYLPGPATPDVIVPGPGFRRRRQFLILWPFFALILVVVAAAAWIVIS